MKYNSRKTLLAIFFVMLFLSGYTIQALAQTSQETLNQYIADLQKNPNDNALREKIIKHVQTMKLAPAIPEEAKKYMARGKAAFKGAKEINDFNDAASEFQKALLAAPWLAEGYYNLGIVQDKAGQHNAAKQSLKLYLAAAPNAPDVEKVKELIYEIDYRQEKAAKESSPEFIAEKKQKAEDEFIKKLDGVRYVYRDDSNVSMTLDIHSNKVIWGWICLWKCEGFMRGDIAGIWQQDEVTTLSGREFTLCTDVHCTCRLSPYTKTVLKGKISNDGDTITTRDACGETKIYHRER